MTKYSIKLRDLFGSAFYDYNLYTSNYNPKIDTTIVVTCQVKNIFGNPVANKELVLYYKGVAQDPVTTNANGIAEWEIDVGTTGGTYKFSVNNKYIFINVNGYKQIKSYSSGFYTLSINEFTRTARLSLNTQGSKSIASGVNYEQTAWIPSEYRPLTNANIIIARNISLTLNIGTTGNVSIYNPSTSTVTANTSASIYYNY